MSLVVNWIIAIVAAVIVSIFVGFVTWGSIQVKRQNTNLATTRVENKNFIENHIKKMARQKASGRINFDEVININPNDYSFDTIFEQITDAEERKIETIVNENKTVEVIATSVGAEDTENIQYILSEIIPFWKQNENNGFLSNFYSSDVNIFNLTFACNEQFYMFMKALYVVQKFEEKRDFNHQILNLIASANTILYNKVDGNIPKFVKALGRKLIVEEAELRTAAYTSYACKAMYLGLKKKFENAALKDNLNELLSQGKKHFVEITKSDGIWGIFKDGCEPNPQEVYLNCLIGASGKNRLGLLLETYVQFNNGETSQYSKINVDNGESDTSSNGTTYSPMKSNPIRTNQRAVASPTPQAHNVYGELELAPVGSMQVDKAALQRANVNSSYGIIDFPEEMVVIRDGCTFENENKLEKGRRMDVWKDGDKCFVAAESNRDGKLKHEVDCYCFGKVSETNSQATKASPQPTYTNLPSTQEQDTSGPVSSPQLSNEYGALELTPAPLQEEVYGNVTNAQN